MIKVGIVGASGYTAGELIRCLVHHPDMEIDFLYSHSQSGKNVEEFHEDLFDYPELNLSQEINYDVDALFLCLGHGNSKQFLSKNKFSASTKIIDLSNDFRLSADAHFNGLDFTYGLVELNKTKIQKSQNIANPGCFATAIQLALLPLAKAGLLKTDVHINAITGSTGAGQKPSETSHFSWRNNNVSIYKAFNHQHLGEIGESIVQLQNGFSEELNFLPLRGNFTRGILASVYTKSDKSEEEIMRLFQNFYAESNFVKVSRKNINLKQVVNTNYALLQVQKIDGKVLITSAIDNLLKGAAGQAIENLNLMFGFAPKTGLHFKANFF